MNNQGADPEGVDRVAIQPPPPPSLEQYTKRI